MARTMRILFIGDVVGFAGYRALLANLTKLTDEYKPDLLIVNGENIVDGKGLSEREATELFSAGVHVITTGNHVWENWKSRPLLSSNKCVLRPANYPVENPGRGWTVFTLPDGRAAGIVQIQGRVFMQPIDCPFKTIDSLLPKIASTTNIVIVDFHAEATAEKMAMGWHLDGRVSAILGTHTHVQTADATILPAGTAFITDVGMTGPYDSVIGLRKDVALRRFIQQTAHKYESATDMVRICGVVLDVDENSGHAVSIRSFCSPQPAAGAPTEAC